MNLDAPGSDASDEARNEAPKNNAPAVARAIRILRFLARSEEPLGLNAVARSVGIIPSSCLHILRVLVAEGLVAFDLETKRYSLDAGMLTLSARSLRQDRFVELARPVLDDLASRHRATALGVRLAGENHFVVVAIARAEQGIHLNAEVGSRFPSLISATGRCVAAFGGQRLQELRPRFAALRWDNPPSFASWCAEVEETRRQGYAVDSGSYIAGVTVVSAPVFDIEGRMRSAVVVVGITDQIAGGRMKALIQDVRGAGQNLSEKLGSPRPASGAAEDAG